MQDNVENVHPFSLANLGKFKNGPFGLYYIENMIWFCHVSKLSKSKNNGKA